MALGLESVWFLAQLDEGSESGFALGDFFAVARTARKFDAIVMDGAFKKAGVSMRRGGDDSIVRRRGAQGAGWSGRELLVRGQLRDESARAEGEQRRGRCTQAGVGDRGSRTRRSKSSKSQAPGSR